MKRAGFWLLSLFISMAALAADPTPPIIDLQAIDTSINPCDDFYHYACGKWLDTFALPPDKPAYYRQFSGLEDQAHETLNGLLKAYAAHDLSVPAKYAEKLGQFYASCMDDDAIAKTSPEVLAALYGRVEAIQDRKSLAETVAFLHLHGFNVLFGFSGGQDVNDSTRVIGYTDQGGLSLPEQGYYTKTDAKSLEILREFQKHVQNLLELAGLSKQEATRGAATTLSVEKKLAEKALSLADRMDTSKVNHPIDRAGLAALTPHFDWETYFTALGVGGIQALNAREPEFLKGMDTLLSNLAPDDLKVYLKWQIVHAVASTFPPAFEQEDFRFWSDYLKGQKQELPRWKRCTMAVEGAMSEALGEAYVSQVKGADQVRARTVEMAHAIESAFGQNLTVLDWLDEPTREAAIAKLAKVNLKVGYPDHWRNYDTLGVSPASFAGNALEASAFEMRRNLAKIGQPVDRTEWAMPPWEANAYYDPSMNEMVLPIGELLPPVQDFTASDGANLGSLGATTIGHELTHGFDSNGRQFDGDGNLKDWWTPAVKAAFEQRTQCLVNQANQYEVLPGLKVNGQQTLTENLADQGGAKLAITVLKKILATRPPAAPVGAYNETQQFFLSQAQSWCAKRTEESLRLQVTSNEHPPEEFRVNGVLVNRPEFAEAFSCPAGSRMAPVQRCSVW